MQFLRILLSRLSMHSCIHNAKIIHTRLQRLGRRIKSSSTSKHHSDGSRWRNNKTHKQLVSANNFQYFRMKSLHLSCSALTLDATTFYARSRESFLIVIRHIGGKMNENFYIGGFASRCDTWNAGSVSMRLKIFLTCTSKWSLVFCILLFSLVDGGEHMLKIHGGKKFANWLECTSLHPSALFSITKSSPESGECSKIIFNNT